MSDGITEAWKKEDKEKEIERETIRINMMELDLEKARKALRELKRDK